MVLSDGLGSGESQYSGNHDFTDYHHDVERERRAQGMRIETIIDTLPECQVRKIAYATFTVIEINHEDYRFKGPLIFDIPRFFISKTGTTHESETIYFRQFF